MTSKSNGSSNPLKFGQTVHFSEKMRREQTKKRWHSSHKWDQWGREWVAIPWPASGIFLGYRWLKDGVVDRDWEYGDTFYAYQQRKVALVCPNHRTNPVYLPLNSIKEINNG